MQWRIKGRGPSYFGKVQKKKKGRRDGKAWGILKKKINIEVEISSHPPMIRRVVNYEIFFQQQFGPNSMGLIYRKKKDFQNAFSCPWMEYQW